MTSCGIVYVPWVLFVCVWHNACVLTCFVAKVTVNGNTCCSVLGCGPILSGSLATTWKTIMLCEWMSTERWWDDTGRGKLQNFWEQDVLVPLVHHISHVDWSGIDTQTFFCNFNRTAWIACTEILVRMFYAPLDPCLTVLKTVGLYLKESLVGLHPLVGGTDWMT